jgi:hypothetical protein
MRRFGSGVAQPSRSRVFEIPGHELLVSGHEGAWRVTVDGVAESSLSFATMADAWAAGVREAERLDRGLQAGAFPGA